MSVRVIVPRGQSGYEEPIEHNAGQSVYRNSDGDLEVQNAEGAVIALYPPTGWARVELDPPLSDDAATWRPDLGAAGGDDPLEAQIARLAEAVMRWPGEPSRSEGAVDCAIRLLDAARGIGDPTQPGRVVTIGGLRWQVTTRRYEAPKGLALAESSDRIIVELVPYDPTRTVVGPVPAEVTPDPTDEQVAQARRELSVIAGEGDDEQQPSDGYLDDAETWVPEVEQPPPPVLALMRIDRVLGNEHSLSSLGTGRVRRLTLDALNDWHQAPKDDDAAFRMYEQMQRERDEALARYESMKGKRNRARDHAVRNDQERDEALRELAEVRGERDGLLAEREHWVSRETVDELVRDRDEARAELARKAADWEQRAAEGRQQVDRLVTDNGRLRARNDELARENNAVKVERQAAQSEAQRLARELTDCQQSRAAGESEHVIALGDLVSVADGDGKGVSGVVESWTTAPGGVPFVIVAGTPAGPDAG